MTVSLARMRSRSAQSAAPILIPLGLALAFLVAPWDLDAKLATALSGLCAQRPGHTFLVQGAPMALEARMLGIFAGFALTVGMGWIAGGWRRAELPRGLAAVAFALMVVGLGVDGFNALFFDSGLPHLYTPSNELRLATGLLCGVALAALIAPVISWAFWREREAAPLVASWTDALRILLCLGAFAALVVSGVPGRGVLSLLALGSAVGSFWLVNTYLAVILWQGPGDSDGWGDLAWSGAVGSLLMAGELAVLAALRGWAETSLGFVYLV
jgi:uncharacterized membrane protein